MTSDVFSGSHPRRQMTLEYDEGILSRYRHVRDVVAQGVYQRGLKRIAGQLDKSPGNLSSELADDSQRKFGCDDLEAYIRETGDKTPIHYLIAKYLGDDSVVQTEAVLRVQRMLQDLPAVLAEAGFQTPKGRRR